MKNAIGLFAALCLALLVAFFVYFFQKSGQKNTEEKMDTRAILVSTVTLNPGERVDKSKFEWTQWPTKAIQSDYIRKDKPEDIKSVDGAVLRGIILKGEPVKKADLVTIGDKSAVTAFVRPGLRAASIPLTRVSNPSIHYSPGDYVDIIFTKRGRGSEGDTESIIRGVRVIAVDEHLVAAQGQRSTDETKQPKNITVELTPPQAEELASAIQEGNVAISQYSAFAPPTQSAEHVPVQTVLRKEPAKDETEPEKEREKIKILRGNEK